MYVDVQYKLGTTYAHIWNTFEDGNAISAGATETYTIPTAQNHNSVVYIQYRASSSDNPTGSYTSISSHTINCPTTSWTCLLYTSPSPRDATLSRMPSSA